MILYHGSNVEVRKPIIINTNRCLDFGAGFYTTTDFEQARRWSNTKVKRKKTGAPTISVYTFDESLMGAEGMACMTFEKANAEWLNYVAANRTGTYCGPQYDIVAGPVANDRTILVVNDYLSGAYPFETAVTLLETAKLKDQYAFLTSRAVQTLHFEEVIHCDGQ